jgi:hypothetical protein
VTVISDGAIASAARGAGLSGESVAIAVAVALAESGGDANAHNALPPDNSYGLWQINMLGSMGPERRRQFGLTSNEQLYDPATNARAMFAISNGGKNWRPWTTFTRGTYLRFMARGRSAAGSNDTTTLPNNGLNLSPVGLSGSLDGITGLLQILQSPQFWIRMGLVIGGVGIAFYGLMKVTGDNQLSQGTKTVANAALGLIPGGSTVKTGVQTVAKVVK